MSCKTFALKFWALFLHFSVAVADRCYEKSLSFQFALTSTVHVVVKSFSAGSYVLSGEAALNYLTIIFISSTQLYTANISTFLHFKLFLQVKTFGFFRLEITFCAMLSQLFSASQDNKYSRDEQTFIGCITWNHGSNSTRKTNEAPNTYNTSVLENV